MSAKSDTQGIVPKNRRLRDGIVLHLRNRAPDENIPLIGDV